MVWLASQVDLCWCWVTCHPCLVLPELYRRHCVLAVVPLVLCAQGTAVWPFQGVENAAGMRDDMFGSADPYRW